MSGNNMRPGEGPGVNTPPTSFSTHVYSVNHVSNFVSAQGLAAVTLEPPAPTEGLNALSVLIPALSSEVITPIYSEFPGLRSIASQFINPQNTQGPEPSYRPDHTSKRPQETLTHGFMGPTSSRPRHTSRSTSQLPTTSTPSSLITSITSSPSTLSTTTRSSSTISTVANAATAAAPTAAPAPSLANASIAGIATGVTAGAVVILLGAFFLFRRRQQGKAPFARKVSQRSGRAYPEVAWLYDPAPSPPPEGEAQDSHRSDRALLNPEGGATEMTAMASTPGTPDLRVARPESPLLPPVMPAARGLSPGGSPSGSARSSMGSSSGGRRSGRSSAGSVGRMVPISEEPRV